MIPYRKILIPTDGSDNSKPAILYALGLARSAGTEVTAFYVIDMSNYANSSEDVFPAVGSPLYGEGEEAVRYVIEQGRNMGVDVKPLVINGIPARDIVWASEKYDLIVMGTVGRTGLVHLLLGSVAEKVIRSAACPVLVVHRADVVQTGGQFIRRLLIPTDGSNYARSAIQHGLELAKIYKAEVTALSVADMDTDQSALDVSRWAVDAVVDDGRKLGLVVRGTIVNGSPANEIVKASKDHDLIVMGTAGRTGLSHLRLGSVAERTVRHAECPVLVVRAIETVGSDAAT